MRVVNRKVAELIRNRKIGKASENTRVYVDGDNWADVYLFDKHIARYTYATGAIDVNMNTFQAWPTPTTVDRLNGLFCSFDDSRFARYGANVGIYDRHTI